METLPAVGQPALSQPAAEGKLHGNQAIVMNPRKSFTNMDKRGTESKLLEMMPLELILDISDHLPSAAEKTTFALTCKPLFYVLFTKHVRTAMKGLQNRVLFLYLVEPDVPETCRLRYPKPDEWALARRLKKS